MNQFISFVTRHWELWLLFFALLLAYAALELRDLFRGIRALSPQAVTHLINREDAIILDIRDSSSYAKGHILKAINIPFKELNDKIKTIEQYKSKPVVIAYGNGQPTSTAISLLLKNGFTRISSLKGGMSSWLNANLPVEK